MLFWFRFYYPPKLKPRTAAIPGKMSSQESRKREHPEPQDQCTKVRRSLEPLEVLLDITCPLIQSTSAEVSLVDEISAPREEVPVLHDTKQQVKRKKGGKQKVYKVVPPIVQRCAPVVKLSSHVLGSIYSVLGVDGIICDDHHGSVVVLPMLHPHQCDKDMYAILQSRNNTGQETVHEREVECAFIGALTCQLEGCLDLGGIFKDGGTSVRLVLILNKSEAMKWQVRIEVGEGTWLVPVKMDQRLDEVSFECLKQMLQGVTPLVKLFLPHDSSCGATKSLPLELWATDKICNSSYASDYNRDVPMVRARKQVNEAAVHQLVKTLHPSYSMEEHSVQGLWSCGVLPVLVWWSSQ